MTVYATGRHATRLVLRGGIDADAVPELTAALRTALSRESVREMIVDLSGVTLLSAEAANALSEARDQAVERDIALALVGAHGVPKEALVAAGMAVGVFTRTPDGLRGSR